MKEKSTVENILDVLDVRFRVGTDQALQLSLEGIEDLQRLKALHRTALRAESLDAFMQTLETNGK